MIKHKLSKGIAIAFHFIAWCCLVYIVYRFTATIFPYNVISLGLGAWLLVLATPKYIKMFGNQPLQLPSTVLVWIVSTIMWVLILIVLAGHWQEAFGLNCSSSLASTSICFNNAFLLELFLILNPIFYWGFCLVLAISFLAVREDTSKIKRSSRK